LKRFNIFREIQPKMIWNNFTVNMPCH